MVVPNTATRSEEHTSELQSRVDLVCRLLLEKKKNSSAISPPCSVPSLRCRTSALTFGAGVIALPPRRTSARSVVVGRTFVLFFFFLKDPAPPEISPFPLPAPLPI